MCFCTFVFPATAGILSRRWIAVISLLEFLFQAETVTYYLYVLIYSLLGRMPA